MRRIYIVVGQVNAGFVMSGRLLGPASIQADPRKTTWQFAARLGCSANSSQAIVDCARAASVEDILNVTATLLPKSSTVSFEIVLYSGSPGSQVMANKYKYKYYLLCLCISQYNIP